MFDYLIAIFLGVALGIVVMCILTIVRGDE